MTTIKLKNGSGAPLAGDLVQGEPALDLTNKRLYTEDSGGTVIEVGTNPTSLTTGTFTSTGIDDNAASTAITIDGSQNVGIGTDSPSKKLEVFDSNNSTTTVSGIEVVNHSLTEDSRAGIAFRNFDNFGASLWSPRTGTSAGALVFGTNGGAGVAETNITERMRIDSSGQVRLSNTTPVWDTTFSSLVTKGGFIGSQSTSYLYSGQNLYYNGGFKYSASSTATLYEQSFGNHIFYNAPSGTAGNAVSLTPAMTLSASGNLLVGTTSTSGGRHFTIGNATAPAQSFQQNGTEKLLCGISGGTNAGVTGSASGDYFARTTGGKMLFSTNDGVTAHAVIDASGNLLVGKTAVGISSAGFEAVPAGTVSVTRADTTLQLNRLTTDGEIANFRKDGTTVGGIGTLSGLMYIGNGDCNLLFTGASDAMLPVGTNGATKNGQLDLGSSGNRFKDLYLSGGVYLGGTGSANKLDDYEEGTWTPGFTGATITPTITTGNYTKIGRVVYFNYYSDASTIASASGTAEITGLPFQVKNNSSAYQAFYTAHNTFFGGSTTNGVEGFVLTGSTGMRFTQRGFTSTVSFVDGTSKYIMVTGFYITDA